MFRVQSFLWYRKRRRSSVKESIKHLVVTLMDSAVPTYCQVFIKYDSAAMEYIFCRMSGDESRTCQEESEFLPVS